VSSLTRLSLADPEATSAALNSSPESGRSDLYRVPFSSRSGGHTQVGGYWCGEPYRSKYSGMDRSCWYCTSFCAMVNLLFKWPHLRSAVAHSVSHYLGGMNHHPESLAFIRALGSLQGRPIERDKPRPSGRGGCQGRTSKKTEFES
jgi:hypothetical protein